MEYCKCGSIIVNSKCTNDHCPEKNQKCKEWVVGGRSLDFKKPVSFAAADSLAKKLNYREKNN